MLGTSAALLLTATIAAGAGQIYSGISANQAASEKAGLQEEQARIALSESEREVEQKSVERRKFLAQQRMSYLASGVSLSGTPGIVQGDTFKEFQQEIDALRKSGVAQYGLGLREAAGTRSSGRASLISGIMSGAGTILQGAASVKGSSTTGKSQSEILGFNTKAYR